MYCRVEGSVATECFFDSQGTKLSMEVDQCGKLFGAEIEANQIAKGQKF